MELLFEEFFGKIWKLINGIYFPPIRIFARLLFYSIFVALFALVAWCVWKGNYTILILIVCLFIIGELAHFIRKSMEKGIDRKLLEEEKQRLKLKKSKSRKKHLKKSKTKTSNPKNDSLPESDSLSEIEINEKPKNKDLLSDFEK